MEKDFGRFTVHINRYYLSNWAVGLDYYQLNERDTRTLEASVFQLNFVFFNITITRWHKWI